LHTIFFSRSSQPEILIISSQLKYEPAAAAAAAVGGGRGASE